MFMRDLKYLFAYTVPLATWVSITSQGWLTFAAPIYTFVFIPNNNNRLNSIELGINHPKIKLPTKPVNTAMSIKKKTTRSG